MVQGLLEAPYTHSEELWGQNYFFYDTEMLFAFFRFHSLLSVQESIPGATRCDIAGDWKQEAEIRIPPSSLRPDLNPGLPGPPLPFPAQPALKSDWRNQCFWHTDHCLSLPTFSSAIPPYGMSSFCLLLTGKAKLDSMSPLPWNQFIITIPTHPWTNRNLILFQNIHHVLSCVLYTRQTIVLSCTCISWIFIMFCHVYFAVSLKSLTSNVLWVDLYLVP